jgi:hypothetical protein
MCLNNNPKPPSIQKLAAPPPVQPLQIAKTSRIEPVQVKKQETKPVVYGSKSTRNATNNKTDAASLLVPLNVGTSGGINT